jgi:hypothetical protein
MSISALNTSCPHDEKCLLLQKAFNHYCVTCQMCRMGIPDEYAVHIKGKDGISEVKRLSELPASGLGSNVDRAILFSLSDENFFSKEVMSIGIATDV